VSENPTSPWASRAEAGALLAHLSLFTEVMKEMLTHLQALEVQAKDVDDTRRTRTERLVVEYTRRFESVTQAMQAADAMVEKSSSSFRKSAHDAVRAVVDQMKELER
jgi:hypothetical protein